MKKAFVLTISFLLFSSLTWCQAQDLETIQLNKPDMERGASLMTALSKKASVQNWSEKELGLKDLSDLLWAAAGINRTNGKRTYSSAQNAQDVDLFVFLKEGVYLYDATDHELNPVLIGDHRGDIAASFSGGGGQGGKAQPSFPVNILLVSDTSRFRAGPEDLKSEWGAISAGIITQNIMLFCSANGLGTHPRAMFDKDVLRKMLSLKDTQNPILELPVGYP
jgi:SagB-type dehydrogenase family enzyme